MSRSTKRTIVWILLLIGFMALLSPGYSSVYVEGPTGLIKTEQFKFGPGGLIVYTRVVADESTVRIEQQ